MKEIALSKKISYLEAVDSPLSADVGIIREGGTTWLFDVGCGEAPLAALQQLQPGHLRAVLSHFHPDHTGNAGLLPLEELYGSAVTCRHTRRGTVVTAERVFGGLRIFPLPSSHAKGCLGLEVDGTYAFVGDSLYSKVRDGFYVYNAQLLHDEIAVLKRLRTPVLLVSHHPGLVRPKAEVLAELEDIYALRQKDSHEIRVPMPPHG